MAERKTKVSKADKMNAATNAFLQELNGGPLSFGEMLTALRESEEQTLNQFATRLGVSRQHLHRNRSAGALCPKGAEGFRLRAWQRLGRFAFEGGRTGRASWRSSSGVASGRLTSARSAVWD